MATANSCLKYQLRYTGSWLCTTVVVQSRGVSYHSLAFSSLSLSLYLSLLSSFPPSLLSLPPLSFPHTMADPVLDITLPPLTGSYPAYTTHNTWSTHCVYITPGIASTTVLYFPWQHKDVQLSVIVANLTVMKDTLPFMYATTNS